MAQHPYGGGTGILATNSVAHLPSQVCKDQVIGVVQWIWGFQMPGSNPISGSSGSMRLVATGT